MAVGISAQEIKAAIELAGLTPSKTLAEQLRHMSVTAAKWINDNRKNK